MSYDFSYQGDGEIVGFLVVYMILWLVLMAFGIVSYILSSLGTYTIAKRRELNHPWMAWVPVLNLWILGSISDQYQYVVQDKIRNKRKWLIGLYIAYIVVFLVSYIGIVVSAVASELSYSTNGEEALVVSVLVFLLGWLLAAGLGIAMSVIRYIAMYDLYRSCKPDNAALFLVLSILVSVTEPFFVFSCRKKDEGMPPRRPRPTGYIPEQYGYQPQAPVYPSQPMGYQPPEAPTYRPPEYRPYQYRPEQPAYRPEPVEEPPFWSPAEPEAPPTEESWDNQ